MNTSSFCLPEEALVLSGSPLEAFLYTVLFPPLCIFGLVGNTLTISVLISHDFMSRANIFLTCLAVCDICFLLLIIPHSLANFNLVGMNLAFRQFYLPSKLHLIAFANWGSAVAIWLVVGVSFERVVGVRWPLHQLTKPSGRKLASGLLLLLSACAMLTFYNHVSHYCVSKLICNDTQLLSTCMDVDLEVWHGNRTNFSPLLLRRYVRWTRAAHAIFVLIIPLFLLVILNLLLFYYVKNRSFYMYASLGKVTERVRLPGQTAIPPPAVTLFRRHSDQILQQKTEHRVAVTVCAVVTSFTITQAPSAAVLCINTLWPDVNFSSQRKTEWYALTVVTSFLVIVGKSLNFVVFCLSSSSFRHRLLVSLRSKFGWRQERWKAVPTALRPRNIVTDRGRCQSVNTQYTRCDSRDSQVLSAKKSFQSI